MNLKKALIGLAAAVTIGASVQVARAATICNGCDYIAGQPATYLGAHNAATLDLSTFQHVFNPHVSGMAFIDYWVFDIAPSAAGSASADFTISTAIDDFAGALYFDTGSTCPGGPETACTSLAPLGALIASDTVGGPSGTRRWEIEFALLPGRYVLVVTGTERENSAYTGQIAFIPRFVPEPNVLALLAVGLIAAGLGARRRAR